jgi:hypothetical protein
MKNSSDAIGNRTRDFPACSAVPQPTVCSNECLTEGDFEEGPTLILHAIMCYTFFEEKGKPPTCQVVTPFSSKFEISDRLGMVAAGMRQSVQVFMITSPVPLCIFYSYICFSCI